MGNDLTLTREGSGKENAAADPMENPVPIKSVTVLEAGGDKLEIDLGMIVGQFLQQEKERLTQKLRDAAARCEMGSCRRNLSIYSGRASCLRSQTPIESGLNGAVMKLLHIPRILYSCCFCTAVVDDFIMLLFLQGGREATVNGQSKDQRYRVLRTKIRRDACRLT